MRNCKLTLLTALPLLLAACSADNVLSSADDIMKQANGELQTTGDKQETPPADRQDDKPDTVAEAQEGLTLQYAFSGADTRAGTDLQTDLFPEGSEVKVWLNNIKEEYSGTITAINSYKAYICTVASDGSTLTPQLTPSGTKLMYPGVGNYPYSYGIKPANFTAGTFSVQTDQTADDDYIASDLVYSKTTFHNQSSGILPLTFNHLLSKIVVGLQAGDGVSAADLENALVTVKAKKSCTFNYPSQEVVAASDVSGDVADIAVSPNGACIIPPQAMDADALFISVTLYGADPVEVHIPTGTKTFEGGKQYVYSITVSDDEFEVAYSVSVGDWTPGGEVTLQGDGKL